VAAQVRHDGADLRKMGGEGTPVIVIEWCGVEKDYGKTCAGLGEGQTGSVT